MSTTLVNIVEDDKAVASSMEFHLEAAGFRVRLHGDAEAFLRAYRPDQPQCMLLDLLLPGRSGLDLLEDVQLQGLPIITIVLTAHGDIRSAVAAMKHGAMEFLEKPVDGDGLLALVREAGKQAAREWRVYHENARKLERWHSLSRREKQVMMLVAAGRTNREISGELVLSTRTIEHHRERALAKLEVDSVAQVVQLVMTLNANGQLK